MLSFFNFNYLKICSSYVYLYRYVPMFILLMKISSLEIHIIDILLKLNCKCIIIIFYKVYAIYLIKFRHFFKVGSKFQLITIKKTNITYLVSRKYHKYTLNIKSI